MLVDGWAMNKQIANMLGDRTIVVSGELGQNLSTAVVSQLLMLDATDPGVEIKLYIDCSGGALSASFAICDTINWIGSDVSTWAIGAVGSAATLVLCSGAAGRRYALPGSYVILRQPGRDEGLDELSTRLTAAAYHSWVDEMVQILSERTGRKPNTIARDLRNNRRLLGADSVTYGVVDRVVAGGKFAPQGN